MVHAVGSIQMCSNMEVYEDGACSREHSNVQQYGGIGGWCMQ
jgi:hypothetical protein